MCPLDVLDAVLTLQIAIAAGVPGGLAVMRDSVAGLLSYVWRNSDTVKAERNGFARLAL